MTLVVPVKVTANNFDCSLFKYAFLDFGSSRSFCTTDLAKSLGLSGDIEECTIHTANGSRPHVGNSVSFRICGVNESDDLSVDNILTFDDIPDLQDSIPHQEIVQRYAHLHDLSFPRLESTIDILIGSDVLGRHPISATRVGEEGSPTAYHTVLGWALAGPDKNAEIINNADINFLQTDTASKFLNDSPFCHICGHDFVDLYADPCTTEFLVDDRKHYV